MAKFDEVLVERVVRGQSFKVSELTDDDKREVVLRLQARGHGNFIAQQRLGLSPASVRAILDGETVRSAGTRKASRRTRVLLRVGNRDDAMRLTQAIAGVMGIKDVEKSPLFDDMLNAALEIIEHLRDSQPAT